VSEDGGAHPPPWWQEAVFYQVYPRSFADSDGDGVGDLAGIRAHLDDLAWLGVDALWISPFFRSPMADFGYDVSDYCDVDPLFGDLAAFDALVADAHARGMRVVIDWVPNHTSDQHPWFLDACSSRDSPRRNWYVWRDPTPDGSPPTTGWPPST
jgi:glycosidase